MPNEIRMDRRGQLRCVSDGRSYVVRAGGAGTGVRYRYYFIKNDVPVSCTAEMRRFVAARSSGGAPGDADADRLRPELWAEVVARARVADFPALRATSRQMAALVDAQEAEIERIRKLPLDGGVFERAVADLPAGTLLQLRTVVGDVLARHPFQAQHDDPADDEAEYRVFSEYSQKNEIIEKSLSRVPANAAL